MKERYLSLMEKALSAYTNEQILKYFNDTQKNGLTERHARALLRVEDQDLLMDLLETVLDQALNVKETETLIAAALTPKEKVKRPRRFGAIKDIRLCINTLEHTVATLRQAGIKPQTQIHDEERFVEYIIRIPKTS